MNLKEYLKDHLLFLDGGTGTLLQQAGLPSGELPEIWNLTHKEEVKAIARAYYDAGCNVVCANTFGANLLKFESEELKNVIFSAVELVKQAQKESRGTQEKFVALDVGPCGRLHRRRWKQTREENKLPLPPKGLLWFRRNRSWSQ